MAVSTKSLIYAIFLCNIYSTYGNTAHISYIGCYHDAYNPQAENSKPALRVLPHGHLRIGEGMTIGTCIKFCTTEQEQDLPMQYAGVETGNECWCGTAEAQYDLYGQLDDSKCMERECSGNPLQFCGFDFRIAVYNLTLVRCQLPKTPGLDTSNPDFIPVYDNAIFTCLPGYQLSGPSSVQCIFDDDITDTRWSSQCLSRPTTLSTTTTTGTHSTQDLTTKSDLESTSDMNLPAIIGGVVGACVIFVMILVVLVILRSRRKRKSNEATQSHGTQMSPTHGSTTKTQQKDPSDSFPVYSQPVRPASRGKSLHQERTNGDVKLPNQEKPNSKTDELYSYADLRKQEKPNAKTDELYSYADVRINSPNAAETNKVASDSIDWEDNNLYSRTEETTDEGWRDNNIYEAS